MSKLTEQKKVGHPGRAEGVKEQGFILGRRGAGGYSIMPGAQL